MEEHIDYFSNYMPIDETAQSVIDALFDLQMWKIKLLNELKDRYIFLEDQWAYHPEFDPFTATLGLKLAMKKIS